MQRLSIPLQMVHTISQWKGISSPRLAIAAKLFIVGSIILAGVQVLQITYREFYHRPAITRAAGNQKVAIWDSISDGAHDEVVIPLLWTLNSLAIPVDVYRDAFRVGTRDVLDAWFKGSIYDFSAFIQTDMTQIDTIILTTADRDAKHILHHRLLDKHPHLKVVAIAHQLPHWSGTAAKEMASESPSRRFLRNEELLQVAKYVQDGRWQFVTLSPHMANGLSQAYNRNPDIRLPMNVIRAAICTFVPIMPVPRTARRIESKTRLYKASIVGKLSGSRAYDRIIQSLFRAKTSKPNQWRKSTFVLSLLGKPVGRKPYSIPPKVRSIIKEAVGSIDFVAFYLELSSSDIVLPAFANKERYTSQVASGAIPAAVMARVPVLVDADELQAYSYLEHPAYILREQGVDEIRTIQKLREQSPLAATESANTTAAWELYEQKVYMQNKHALQKALQLPSILSIPQNGISSGRQ